MMRNILLLALVGCEPATDEKTTDTWTSETGAYTLQISTDPDPPVAGEVVLLLDAPGVTSLSVVGSMSGMDHGFSEDPVVTGEDGSFAAAVVFSMSGTWGLVFTVDGESGEDTISGELEVQ